MAGQQMMSWRELESQLRTCLAPVDLVCDAEIPNDFVDQAEKEIRKLLASSSGLESVPTTRPATLVVYFVIRGSERYRGNSIWPQLGVTSQTQRAGQAFVKSLARVGMPTFEQQVRSAGARTYVAPMLMHGAFPASAAHRLVERVEEELRRGLVDAHEARLRLLDSPDLHLAIGRPAARLLAWAPLHSERLLDAVIGFIEGDAAATTTALPAHVRHALETGQTNQSSGLRRLVFPQVELDTWSGFGPELTAPDQGGPWKLWLGGRTDELRRGESIDLPSDQPVRVEVKGHRRQVWAEARSWLFDRNGRLVPDKAEVSGEAIVLMPANAHATGGDGAPLHVLEEGVPLSAEWSDHRCERVGLGDSRELVVVDRKGNRLKAWGAEPEQGVRLDGEPLTALTSLDGRPVHAASPQIAVSDGSGSARVELTGADGVTVATETIEAVNGSAGIADVIGDRPFDGTLSVRTAVGSSLQQAVLLLPGLHLTLPDRLLGPDELASIKLEAAFLDRTIEIQSREASAEVRLDAIDRSILVRLPRVEWALRDGRPARLDIAESTIEIDADVLVDRAPRLLIRCGRPAEVRLEVRADGSCVQQLPSSHTKPATPHHLVSFGLDAARDTLRRYSGSYLELVVAIDDLEWTAVACGEPRTSTNDRATRSWGQRVEVRREVSDAALRTARLLSADEINRLDDADAVLWFLRCLGQRSQSWASTEFPNGRSGFEWSELNAAVDRRWNLDGLRYRLFEGDLTGRLRSWASSWRHRLGRTDSTTTLGLATAIDGLVIDRLVARSWRHHDWVAAALAPGRSRNPTDDLPAIVVIDMISGTHGDERAFERIALVTDTRPELVVEALAFTMAAVRRVGQFQRPPSDLIERVEREPEVDPEHVHTIDHDELLLGRPPSKRPATVGDLVVEVRGRSIHVLADAQVELPSLRLVQVGRARAVVPLMLIDGFGVVEVPDDIDGDIGVEIVNRGPLSVVTQPDLSVILEPAPTVPQPAERTARALQEVPISSALTRIDVINLATATGGLGLDEVEHLFEDERLAADALTAYATQTDDPDAVDRVALSVLASSMLFSRLVDRGSMLTEVANASRLLYVALAPRTADAWSVLAWPRNIRFTPTTAAANAFAGWANRLAARHPADGLSTWRYLDNAQVANAAMMKTLVSHLDRQGVSDEFIDIVVATHRMLNFDSVMEEALRMLLSSHGEAPEFTTDAVVAGVAAHLITSGSES